MRNQGLVVLVCFLWLSTGARLQGQGAVAPAAAQVLSFTDADLDQLLGPIALYPDPLLAQLRGRQGYLEASLSE